MSAVRALCEELALANHILSGEDVVDAFGHISARHPERPDRFLLSQAVSPAAVTADDILELTLDGEVVGGEDRKSYLERFIHAGIYAVRPDVGAVVHNHSQDLIPYGVTGTPIRSLIHTAGAIGAEVPVWDIADRFGDTSLLVTDLDCACDLARTLGENTAVLMRGHGATVAGASVREAVLLAIYLQINARVDLRARQLRPVRYLSAQEVVLSRDALLGAGPAIGPGVTTHKDGADPTKDAQATDQVEMKKGRGDEEHEAGCHRLGVRFGTSDGGRWRGISANCRCARQRCSN